MADEVCHLSRFEEPDLKYKNCLQYSSGGAIAIRTNIDIDGILMRQAILRSGFRTKKAAVEAGLRLPVQTHSQEGIRELTGKLRWEGNLEVSREGE